MCIETFRLRAQLQILIDVQKEYKTRTIENIISNIQARIKYIEENSVKNVNSV